MPLSDFTTLSIVKVFLGIASTNTTQDALLNQLIPYATAGIIQYLGRDPRSQTYTADVYSGNGQRLLELRQRPVTAVSRVNIDPTGDYNQGTNAYPSGTDLVAGRDYAIVFDSYQIGRAHV